MQEFGKYQLASRIGAGGMAEVFLARSFGAEGLEKQVVIKRIRPENAQNPRFVSMFIDEAKIAVSLNHPNVVQVYEFGRVDQDFYLAMEYVEGTDLARLQSATEARDEAFPVADAIYLGIEVAKGLDYAHRKNDAFGRPLNIVHRDVSPQNILISRDGGVKLLDFGIAKATGVGDGESEIKGKFSYMSPEQARGDAVDGRSDIFSLGIVLWETLSGETLFPYTTAAETMRLVKNAVVPDIVAIRPDVGVELGEILKVALSLRPEDRFATARDLQIALTRCLFGTGTIADSVTLAQFLGRAGEGEGSRPASVGGYTAPRVSTQAPTASVEVDTSERLLDELVSDTGLRSHITEAPSGGRVSGGGTAISAPEAWEAPKGPTLTQTERKDVVLVCGDLRGFSTLRGLAHYERWQQVLMDYVRIVEAIAFKNNALVDRLGEQGFTLALGLPVSSENDAARAIQLAWDLIEAVEAMNLNLESPLQLSIGAVVGSVVLEFDFTPEGKSPAYGAGAQRLSWSYDDEEPGRGGLYLAEALARAAMAREILVGGRVLRRVRRLYRAEPIQRVEVELDEGRVELAAHRIDGLKSSRDQVKEVRHAYQKLFGRELALKSLRETYRGVLLDRKVKALLITGEQGVGKSTLVNEFLAGLAEGQGEMALTRGVAELHDKDTAYGSLTSLMLELLGLQGTTDLRRARARLESLPGELLSELSELDQRFVVHGLSFLLGVKIPGNLVEGLEPESRRAALVRSLEQFLVAMASRQPMLMAIEDAHNIDASTLSFLADTLERLKAPILLLMTALPPDVGDATWGRLLASPGLSVESLGELEPQGARELAGALLPESLEGSEAVVEALIARAGGNPLYIKELVELIAERGLEDPREIVLQLDATDSEAVWIPTTVEGLIASRIDRLAPEVRKTLQRCGLFGPTFSEAMVRAVLGDDIEPGSAAVMEHLKELVKRGFLHRVDDWGRKMRDSVSLRRRREDQSRVGAPAGLSAGREGEREWAFPNSVMTEVVGRGVVEPERSELHERIATFMLERSDDLFQVDVVHIAHHLDAAGQGEQAGELYLVAAHQAMTSVGGDECLRLVDKALARIEAFGDHHREALDLKEQALALLGRPEERREILEALLKMADSPRRRLQVQGRLLRLNYERGELAEVEAMAAGVLQEAREHDDQRAVGSALRLLHMIYRDTGRHELALELIDEAIGCFQAVGDTEGLWAALVSRGITLRQGGRLTEALEAYKTALSIIEGQPFRRQEHTTRTNLGLLYANLGDYDRARENYEGALASIRALGHVRDEAALLANLGHLYMLYGEVARAHSTLVNAVRLARRTRDKLALADALLTLGVVHFTRGRLREGEALLHKGIRLAREISNIYLTSHGLMGMARLKLEEGSRASFGEALGFAAEAASIGRQAHLSWVEAMGTSLVAEAHWKLGDQAEAVARSQEAVERVGEAGFEGAEHVLARHARIGSALDPEGSARARDRARRIVRSIAGHIKDEAERLRYLQSRPTRDVLES